MPTIFNLAIHSEVAACTMCAASLAHAPRPVLQFGTAARSAPCVGELTSNLALA